MVSVKLNGQRRGERGYGTNLSTQRTGALRETREGGDRGAPTGTWTAVPGFRLVSLMCAPLTDTDVSFCLLRPARTSSQSQRLALPAQSSGQVSFTSTHANDFRKIPSFTVAGV
ncbi:hypothetical protein MRX96_019796 [Rhipicephalus microplus]